MNGVAADPRIVVKILPHKWLWENNAGIDNTYDQRGGRKKIFGGTNSP